MSPEFRLLQRAIDEGRNVAAIYGGHERLMTPHTLGWKQDREQCLLYQYGGTSSSQTSFQANSPENWRCVRVERLSNLRIVDGQPQTCTRHTRQQTCVDDVLCEITRKAITASRNQS